VHLDLTTRRFFCDNSECKRVTFTERLPTVVAPYARRTQRLADAQQDVALEVGGELSARLLTRLFMTISGDTVLRLIPRELETDGSPRILGVDDWALRKGQTYGTILVDLETRSVVDLLPECSAEALAIWLRDHPGVEIISRDRGNEYIKGATAGAPSAVQVADRSHLVQNLVDTLKRMFQGHATDLRAAASQIAAAPPTPEDIEMIGSSAPTPMPAALYEGMAASPEKVKSFAEL
jgi:transposase